MNKQEKAMSNETDLDWLARNVHVWKYDNAKTISYDPENGMAKYGDGMPFKKFTRQQWLSRRAELQNKPSWKDAPEWANWIAQSPIDGDSGIWCFFAGEPTDEVNGIWSCSVGKALTGRSGLILGYWRDTLEMRPSVIVTGCCTVKTSECVGYTVAGSDLSEQAVTARLQEATDNVLAAVPELKSGRYKFEQFTSIEDSREQEMKQDNGWFERGELPPVGVECDILWNDAEWHKTKILAHLHIDKFNICPVFTTDWDDTAFVDCMPHYKSFRPIRTEREVLISVIIDEMNRYDTDAKLADAILAAGFKLEVK